MAKVYFFCPSCGVAIGGLWDNGGKEGDLCPPCKAAGISVANGKIVDKDAKQLHDARPTRE